MVRPASPASDRYMVLVAGHAEERGGVVFLVEVEFKAVVPLDDPDARTVATRRLRAISDWLEDTDCPLHGYCSDTLKIHGFSTGGVTDEDGARSYAEILTVTRGDGPVSEARVDTGADDNMAFSAIPTAFLGAGYVADATTLTVLLANVSQITSVEADEATGDSRKIIYGLLDKWNTVYAALAAADGGFRLPCG